MTLSEVLEELPEDQIIKLGAADGSSFFFIGRISDLEKNFEKYDKQIKVVLLNSLLNNVKNYASTLKLTTVPKYGLWNEDLERYINQARKYTKEIKVRFDLIDEKWVYYQIVKPLQNREVIEVAHSDKTIEPDVIRILVEGFETGNYWSTDEGMLPSFNVKFGTVLHVNQVEDKNKNDNSGDEGKG